MQRASRSFVNTISLLRSTLIARALLVPGLLSVVVTPAIAQPETVYFESLDHRTNIVGYVFKPVGAGPYPAIVLLHGRGGPYSTNDNAGCTRVAQLVARGAD